MSFTIILLVLCFVIFSNDVMKMTPEYTGIVSEIYEGDNGYTFTFSTIDDEFRCFSEECPEEYGYYGIIGDFSNDSTIFFVNELMDLDENSQ